MEAMDLVDLDTTYLKLVNDVCDRFFCIAEGLGYTNGSHPMNFETAVRVLRTMSVNSCSRILEFG
jgi:hypothetical protein